MAKTQQEILSEIQSSIVSNSVGAITGSILNGILTDITRSLNGSTFLFPIQLDGSVGNCDIGSLMMNDGSGYAKVYQLSPAQAEQTGVWTLTIDSIDSFDNNTSISIKTSSDGYDYSRSDWAYWPGSPEATNVAMELTNLCRFLQGQPPLNYLTFSYPGEGNVLTIRENSFQSTTIYVSNMGNFPLRIIQDSQSALPPAPTSFPLGKLLEIVDNHALISADIIQTYALQQLTPNANTEANGITAGNFSVLNNLYSYNADIPLYSNQDAYNFAGQIIVPAANGMVSPFDITQFINNSNKASFTFQFREQFLGIALSATATTVTVYQVPYLSLLGSIVLRLVKQGIIQFSGINESPFVNPSTGSGSGSGFGSGSGSGFVPGGGPVLKTKG